MAAQTDAKSDTEFELLADRLALADVLRKASTERRQAAVNTIDNVTRDILTVRNKLFRNLPRSFVAPSGRRITSLDDVLPTGLSTAQTFLKHLLEAHKTFPELSLNAIDNCLLDLLVIRLDILPERSEGFKSNRTNEHLPSASLTAEPHGDFPTSETQSAPSQPRFAGPDPRKQFEDDSLVEAKLRWLVTQSRKTKAEGECKKLCLLRVLLAYRNKQPLTPDILQRELLSRFGLNISTQVLTTMIGKYQAWGKEQLQLARIIRRGKYEAGAAADSEFRKLYNEQSFPHVV